MASTGQVVQGSLRSGLWSLGTGIVGGAVGVVTKPVRGLRQDGLSGSILALTRTLTLIHIQLSKP